VKICVICVSNFEIAQFVVHLSNGLKSVATIQIVSKELLRDGAVGSEHTVGMDFNPSKFDDGMKKNRRFDQY
jgi:hypothetical protein